MGKGKNKGGKQLSPEDQKARAEKRRMENGTYVPPGDNKNSTATGRRARGPKCKGAGSVRTGKGPRTMSGVVVKEWQRTPKQILHEWTQKHKRSRAYYQKRPAKPSSKHRVSCYLPDPNPSHKERSLRFTPDQSFDTVLQAEHSAALVALQGIDASIPHEKRLPEPFRTMWCTLVGRSGTIEVKLTVKEQKKRKKAEKLAAIKAAKELQLAIANGTAVAATAVPPSTTNKKSGETKNNGSGSGNNDNKTTTTKPRAPRAPKASSSSSAPRPSPSAAAATTTATTNNRKQRGAPQNAVALTSTQRYQSVHERNQERLKRDAQRSALRREREKHHQVNASVVMSDANRQYIKGILRMLNQNNDTLSSMQDDRNPEELLEMQEQLVNMGFGSDQASLALQMRSTITEALNWLLVNIPEEDLPTSFDPRKRNAISFSTVHSTTATKSAAATGATTNPSSSTSPSSPSPSSPSSTSGTDLQPSTSLERDLYELGFSMQHIRSVLNKGKEKSNLQIPALTLSLYGLLQKQRQLKQTENPEEQADNDDEDEDEEEDMYGEEPLDDEIMVLESMFPDAVIMGPTERNLHNRNSGGGGGMEITMDVDSSVVVVGKAGVPVTIEMWLPVGSNYPNCISQKKTSPHAAHPSCVVFVKHPSLSPSQRERITESVAEQVYALRIEGGYVMNHIIQYVQEQMLKTMAVVKTEENNKRNQARAASTPHALKLKLKQAQAIANQNEKITQHLQHTATSTKSNTGTKNQHQPTNNKRTRNYKHVTILTNIKERNEMNKSLKVFHNNKNKKLKTNKDFSDIQKVRKTLPSAKEEQNIVTCCANNRVVLISGETGCGKTTQVPQFLLNHYMKEGRGGEVNIVCTQPRRIAAIGVAERVAAEQGVALGDVVGYQIRLDRKMSKRTRLLFCTTGILLRRMQGDMDMKGVTHIVVDEVHERSVDTDFLLAVLRQLVKRTNSTVKVVLMSATMDAKLFVRYFNEGMEKVWKQPPPIISIPGRTFPVSLVYLETILSRTGYQPHQRSGWRNVVIEEGGGANGGEAQQGETKQETNQPKEESSSSHGSGNVRPYYLGKGGGSVDEYTKEALQQLQHDNNGPRRKYGAGGGGQNDYDLIAAAVAMADSEGIQDKDDGAILVFMSGTMEISKTMDAIKRLYSREGGGGGVHPSRRGLEDLIVLPLHGSLTSFDQSRIFRYAPRGKRKVVVSTNIAETSITINDCSFVVDSGRFKETQYEASSRMSMLVETYCSLASADQRKGRAGRVRKGRCYRLWTSDANNRLSKSQAPEIHRVPLENLCLQARLLKLGKPMKFLKSVIEPPPVQSIKSAVQHLRALGAFTVIDNELTPLGYHLARMPLDPQIGKMLVYGSLLRCTDDVLTIAAGLCGRSPFLSGMPNNRDDANKAKAKFAGPSRSDHIALLKAYLGWQNAGNNREKRKYCDTNYLSHDGLRKLSDLRRQLATALYDAGFGSKRNSSSTTSSFKDLKSTNVLRAALCAGLYPNIINIKKPERKYKEVDGGAFEKTPEAKALKFVCLKHQVVVGKDGAIVPEQERIGHDGRTYRGPQTARVYLHPASANARMGGFHSPWMVYFHKVKTSMVFVRDSTMVPPYALLLFGGKLDVRHAQNKIVIDGWMYFDAASVVGVVILELRKALDDLLSKKIEDPGIDVSSSKLIDAITKLLVKSGY